METWKKTWFVMLKNKNLLWEYVLPCEYFCDLWHADFFQHVLKSFGMSFIHFACRKFEKPKKKKKYSVVASFAFNQVLKNAMKNKVLLVIHFKSDFQLYRQILFIHSVCNTCTW